MVDDPTILSQSFEVLAVRYGTATMSATAAYHHYEVLGQPDRPLELGYYVWLARNSHSTVLVDTGFSQSEGARRGRRMLIDPREALARLNVRPADVSHVIVTHAHFDHIGNLEQWPGALIAIQEDEVSFWESTVAEAPAIRAFADRHALSSLAAARRAGRVALLGGDATILPGISVRLVGGHTPGQQVVIVETEHGDVVIASDALHLYEEMALGLPFNVFCDLPGVHRAYSLLRRYQDAGALVIAGHDPGVLGSARGVALDDHAIVFR